MKYRVTIQRIEYRNHEFEVEASCPVEAGEKAMDASCDHDFGTDQVSCADAVVTTCWEIGE